MSENGLDAIDRKILACLQRDARMTNAAIAGEVGLTAPSVFERIRKLEQRKVIRGYSVAVDPAALGKPMTAFIRLTVAFDQKYARGLQAISADPDVLECYRVAGEDCLIIKTQAGDPADLEALLDRIHRHITVTRSVTMIALSAVKENGPLSVALPAAARSTNGRKAANYRPR